MPHIITIVAIVIAAISVGFMLYALVTRGFKGATFGYAIEATHDEEMAYRIGSSRHTIRLHKFREPELYGLEFTARGWVGAEMVPIVVPRDDLLKLRDAISHFLAEEPG